MLLPLLAAVLSRLQKRTLLCESRLTSTQPPQLVHQVAKRVVVELPEAHRKGHP